jgi:hypothetical protein
MARMGETRNAYRIVGKALRKRSVGSPRRRLALR